VRGFGWDADLLGFAVGVAGGFAAAEFFLYVDGANLVFARAGEFEAAGGPARDD
jgi:hypothetical protein